MGKGLAGLFLLVVLLPAAQCQELWRQVDEQGVIRYADRPFLNAVRVELPGPGRWAAITAPSPGPTPAERRAGVALQGPSPTLAITRPAAEATVRGAGGELEVTLVMDAAPEAGSRLVLELDGAEAVWRGELPVVRLMQVWRGEHRLRARLVGAGGNELASSEEIRFFKREPLVIKTQEGSS